MTLTPPLDIAKVREEFPVLIGSSQGSRLAYLDNASTTQKPRAVIEAELRFYETSNANIHRAVYALAEASTAAFEGARSKLRRFVNARSEREIIFTRGTTEAINLVARSWGSRLQPSDEIIVSAMEHHSNIVPWQMIALERGAKLRVLPMSPSGDLDLEAFESMLSERVKLVAVAHISNAIGTIHPVKDIVRLAKLVGAITLIDGAQAPLHVPIDVQALGADFYALSGHKMLGPTGIGALWGREELLAEMPPYHGGGDMIRTVSFEGTTYADLPAKFEAGTPNIAGAVGLGAAIDFIEGIGLEAIAAHEEILLKHALERLGSISGLRIIGNPKVRASVLSFVVDGVHPHDLASILDSEGVAIRAGHHCCQPLMKELGVPATARGSFALYNTEDEIDRLARGVEKAKGIFA